MPMYVIVLLHPLPERSRQAASESQGPAGRPLASFLQNSPVPAPESETVLLSRLYGQ